jgi:NAD(P)-dependent dehydrogenase (short-subunit alcohol dehydrogenase family)
METKVALITGAGTGIGKVTALALLREGYKVVLSGRRPEVLESVAQESLLPQQTLIVPTDVTSLESVQALFAKTEAAFGRLDLLFNNAGVGAPAIPLEELSYQQWKDVIDTNLTGSFLCTQEAFKLMKRQQPSGGRIINNGSISAHAPRPNSAPYTASKHAITGLTKATSLDGRKYNIACGQIDIGNADTSMATAMKQGILQANGSVATESTIDAAHVAQAVLYMASLPLGANVQFMTVMATNMPFVGRG